MRSPLRRMLIPFLAVSLPVVVALAVLEGVSRLVLPAYLPPHPRGLYMSDPELGYRCAPRFNGRINWWRRHPIRVRTNSLGLRDREYGEKTPNTARILMVGDSQTFGMVEESASLPRALEKLLNAGERALQAGDDSRGAAVAHFEVVNAGVMGYGTEQELILLRRLLPVYKPDVVVLTFFPNDVEDNSVGVRSHYQVGPDGLLHDLTKPTGEGERRGIGRWLETHVNLAKLASMAVSELRARARAIVRGERFAQAPFKPQGYVRRLLMRDWDEEGVRAWTRTDSLMIEFLRTTHESGAAAILLDGGSREGIGWRVWPAGTDTLKYDLDRAGPLLDGVATRMGVTCVHVLPAFRAERDPESLLLPFDEHWSPAGNRRVAALLAPKVRALLARSGGASNRPGLP